MFRPWAQRRAAPVPERPAVVLAAGYGATRMVTVVAVTLPLASVASKVTV